MCRSRSTNHPISSNKTTELKLCNVMKYDNRMLKTTTVKNLLRPILPENKNMSTSDVFNFMLRTRCASGSMK